jgi:hypothetical protein
VVLLKGAQGASSDEEAAEDKKEDHGAVAARGNYPGKREEGAMPGNFVKLAEEQVTPVLEQNEQSRDTAQRVQPDRAKSLVEAQGWTLQRQ